MNYQNEAERPLSLGRRRALFAATAVCFATAAGVAAYSLHDVTSRPLPEISRNDILRQEEEASSSSSTTTITTRSRSLSVALPNGKCQVTSPILSPRNISPPTWQASFPGSGSRMTWSLIEALTGILTTDDYDSSNRGYEHVVAVKTHFPVKENNVMSSRGRLFERLEDDNIMVGAMAIVVLRNPIHAIPSYFNQQYEIEHHLPNHSTDSTRGSDKDWIKYRDHSFTNLIQDYETFVEYWMEKYNNNNPSSESDDNNHNNRQNLLMVAYEDLTDMIIGPMVARRLVNFLGQVEGVEPIEAESISCIWETIVSYSNNNVGYNGPAAFFQKDEEKFSQKQQKNLNLLQENGGPAERPCTARNLMEVMDMFQRLVERYSFDDNFVRVITSYMKTVSNIEPS